MKITYAQKRAILTHVAHKKAWKNLFNAQNFDREAKPDGTMPDTAYLHALSFDYDDFASKAGIDINDLMTAVKLVVAIDLDLEPTIPTLNVLDENAIIGFVYGDDEKLARIDQDWVDTTDFEGYRTGLPQTFRIQARTGGFDLRMSLDGREALWAQTTLLKRITARSDAPAVQLVSCEDMPRRILHLLQNGASARDHRGREWAYVLIHNKQSAYFARLARITAQKSFRLKGDDFTALSFDNGASLLAMAADTLQHMSRHYRPLFPGV